MESPFDRNERGLPEKRGGGSEDAKGVERGMGGKEKGKDDGTRSEGKVGSVEKGQETNLKAHEK